MDTRTDRVVLIPGFLGYDSFGDHGYFAATVGKAIGAALGGSSAVQAVTTDPAGSLDARQILLVDQLLAMLREDPSARLHLVGHSTGGLDAELLMMDPVALSRGVSHAELATLRQAVASITTIAAPLGGTTLADSPVARLAAIESGADLLTAIRARLFTQLPALSIQVLGALLGLWNDPATTSLVHGALRGGGTFGAYVLKLVLRRALIDDLQPVSVRKKLASKEPSPLAAGVKRCRVVTVARAAPKATPAGRLFALLYRSTAQAAKPDPEVSALALELTRRCAENPALVIGRGGLPPLDVAASDGVVNSARQLFSDPRFRAEELAHVVAVVIADHLDVVGYFEGENGAPSGYLSSGSSFRERELEQLYACVARALRSAGA
jgi:hypothetical protein